jgi:hypothetical protein
MSNVIHGNIREVSLVLAGANIGAHIDNVIAHGEESNEEAYIFAGEDITLSHAEEEVTEEDNTTSNVEVEEPEKKEETNNVEENNETENVVEEAETMAEELMHADAKEEKKVDETEETVADVFETLTEKQVEFISKKEAIDTTTPTGKFMLTVFGAVAELEREYILQRQKEGIAVAKQNGVYKGRKPIEHPDFKKVVAKWQAGEITAVQAMKKLNMTPSTFSRKVKKYYFTTEPTKR